MRSEGSGRSQWPAAASQAPARVRQLIVVCSVLGLSIAVSFLFARRSREQLDAKNALLASRTTTGPATGRYLLAVVLVSSACAACREPETERALRGLRDTLRRSQRDDFVGISVLGVAIDASVHEGTRFLAQIGADFDQTSVGGGWLNQEVIGTVWQKAFARPAVPQVVLLTRYVDARHYPRDVSVSHDSLILAVSGSTDVIRWVNAGAPFDNQGRRR